MLLRISIKIEPTNLTCPPLTPGTFALNSKPFSLFFNNQALQKIEVREDQYKLSPRADQEQDQDQDQDQI